jgi:hypothetical protein
MNFMGLHCSTVPVPGSLPDIHYTAEEMHKNIKSFGTMKNSQCICRSGQFQSIAGWLHISLRAGC